MPFCVICFYAKCMLWSWSLLCLWYFFLSFFNSPFIVRVSFCIIITRALRISINPSFIPSLLPWVCNFPWICFCLIIDTTSYSFCRSIFLLYFQYSPSLWKEQFIIYIIDRNCFCLRSKDMDQSLCIVSIQRLPTCPSNVQGNFWVLVLNHEKFSIV